MLLEPASPILAQQCSWQAAHCVHSAAHAGTCKGGSREQNAMLAPGSVEFTGENVGSASGFTTPGVRRKELPTPSLQAQHVALWTTALC